MLFQNGALFDSLTVAENIRYPLVEHGWGGEEEMDPLQAELRTEGLGRGNRQDPS